MFDITIENYTYKGIYSTDYLSGFWILNCIKNIKLLNFNNKKINKKCHDRIQIRWGKPQKDICITLKGTGVGGRK